MIALGSCSPGRTRDLMVLRPKAFDWEGVVTRQAFFMATLLAATASLAAQAEEPRRPMDASQRRICRTSDQIGTRLERVRRCKTQAEWDQMARESRQVVERIQGLAAPCSPWALC